MWAFFDNPFFWFFFTLYLINCAKEGFRSGYAQEGIRREVRESLRASALRRQQTIGETHSGQGFPAIENLVERGND